LRIGNLDSAQRSVGGITMVVIDGHCDDHREQVLAQGTHRKADGCHNHLSRAARVHAGAERQRLTKSKPCKLAADEGAAEFTDTCDCDQAAGEKQKICIL
jgi:hypothetical protein